MAKCPNKSHPDWKALVEKYGENGAYKRYIENGESIPSLDGSKKSKKGKVTIESKTNLLRDAFNFKSTLDSIEKHPEIAEQMIDELQRRFPWVEISKDGLFDENGDWKEIPAGKVGMHYSSAIKSAIAYANDSYLETVPHEYAHEYINMYRNTKLVKDAINKYGEERLVSLIGKKYTGGKISTQLESFIEKLWKLIRNTFGSPSVVDILTDSFAKNERLGEPLAQGSAIYNYQDIIQPMDKKDSIMNFDEDIERGVSKNVILSKDDASKLVLNDFVAQDFFTEDSLMIKKFDKWWNNLKSSTSALTRDSIGDTNNYAGVDISRVKLVNDMVVGEDEIKKRLISKIKGDEIELTKKEQEVLDVILDLVRAVDHKQKTNTSYLDTDGNMVGDSEVNRIMDQEISDTIQRRKENLESKNKFTRYLAEKATKYIKHVTNTRLWAKYLSGGENTMFSKILYKGMNNGREAYSKYSQDFIDFFKAPVKSFIKGSTFHNPNTDISELETQSFDLDKGLNIANGQSSIELTKAELLSIYLTDRQEGGRFNLEDGIYLQEIKGREIDLSNKYKLTSAQLDDIRSKIENDVEAMELVGEIDNATEYSYNKLNDVFKLLEGYDIPKIENYFPKFHGASKGDVRKKKNVIEDMRSLRARTGGKAVRLVDPFKVLSDMQLTNSSYIGYAIPIHNAQKAIDSIKSKFKMGDDAKYIEELQGTINKVQDSEALFSTQGEQGINRMINKIQGNFAVALLAKNLSVVFKQQVSLETAATEINRKYIRKSGASLGGISIINPVKLLKQLSLKGEETMLPVEWTQLKENPDYQELIKHPLFRDRFEGIISREAGEAIMGKNLSEDKIKLPFAKNKDGSPVYITKSRLMMGITIMDTLTILRLYDAVKLETQDRMNEPGFRTLSNKQIENHNINRLQQIVDKTQPTFDQINRTSLARNSNPLVRSFTMFSSAIQKMSMQMIDSIVDVNNNPSDENKKKMLKRLFHTAITTSVMLSTIDVIWYGITHGWDDDDWDKLPERYLIGASKTTIGSIHGIGSALNIVISQLDSNPWYQTTQDPLQHIIQEGSEAIANIAKGNMMNGTKQILGAYAKTQGLPFAPVSNIIKISKAVGE